MAKKQKPQITEGKDLIQWLYETYWESAVLFVMRTKPCSRAEAEEIVQDTFVALMEIFTNSEDVRSPSAYFWASIRNACTKKGFWRELLADDGDTEKDDGDLGRAVDRMDAVVTLSQLWDAGILSEEEWDLLCALVVYGQTSIEATDPEDIARITKASKAAKIRRTKAELLKKLRKFMLNPARPFQGGDEKPSTEKKEVVT